MLVFLIWILGNWSTHLGRTQFTQDLISPCTSFVNPMIRQRRRLDDALFVCLIGTQSKFSTIAHHVYFFSIDYYIPDDLMVSTDGPSPPKARYIAPVITEEDKFVKDRLTISTSKDFHDKFCRNCKLIGPGDIQNHFVISMDKIDYRLYHSK